MIANVTALGPSRFVAVPPPFDADHAARVIRDAGESAAAAGWGHHFERTILSLVLDHHREPGRAALARLA